MRCDLPDESKFPTLSRPLNFSRLSGYYTANFSETKCKRLNGSTRFGSNEPLNFSILKVSSVNKHGGRKRSAFDSGIRCDSTNGASRGGIEHIAEETLSILLLIGSRRHI